MRVYTSNTGWPTIIVRERSTRPEVRYAPGVSIRADRQAVADVLGSRSINGTRNYQRRKES